MVSEGKGRALRHTEVRCVFAEEPRQSGADDHAKVLASRVVSVVGGSARGSVIGALSDAVPRCRVSPFPIGTETNTASSRVIPEGHRRVDRTVQRCHTCHINIL